MTESLFNRNDACKFVRDVLQEGRDIGLPIAKESIDHLCYRVSSQEEYQAICTKLQDGDIADMRGRLLAESEVNGRMISTFKFEKPLAIEDQLIEAVEIPAPKPGRFYQTGFEHIEVVSALEFEELKIVAPRCKFDESSAGKDFNPEMAWTGKAGTIKFHHLPLSCIIALELHSGVFRHVVQSDLFQAIARWRPLCSGSIPLNLHSTQSDLDVLLEARDLRASSEELKSVLERYGPCSLDLSGIESTKSFTIQLQLTDLKIEFYVAAQRRLLQQSHRHLINEWRWLVREGESLRHKVIANKALGQNTEEAFCQALGLTGDPFQRMLTLS